MAITEFNEALGRLTKDDVHCIARSLESETAGDEVDAWRATVQRAAAAQGIPLPDPDVTHVARAAAEVARGLVAADGVESEVSRLLVHWFPLVVRS